MVTPLSSPSSAPSIPIDEKDKMALKEMSTLANLTTSLSRAKGEVPPALVGASVTVIGDTVWVFGGRPVGTRAMVSTLYALDLRSLTWSLAWSPSDEESKSPRARYFHSASAWGEKLVVWGGHALVSPSSSPDKSASAQLETLADLAVWDTITHTWSLPSPSTAEGASLPPPRYAHLAVVSELFPRAQDSSAAERAMLSIIGGQDDKNDYLSTMHTLDLERMEWIKTKELPRAVGAYRSLACNSRWAIARSEVRGGREGGAVCSVRPSAEDDVPILLLTNGSGSSARPELDLIQSPFAPSPTISNLPLTSSSPRPISPPNLRFPQGAICGTHLVLSGLHISNPSSSEPEAAKTGEYVLWALPLGEESLTRLNESKEVKGEWRRVLSGDALGRGSWSKGVLWRDQLVIFGAAERDILLDYAKRETHFGDLIFVSLEPSSIYQPPHAKLSPELQSLGLMALAQPHLADFSLVPSSGPSIGCSRLLLQARWPWLSGELSRFKEMLGQAQTMAETEQSSSPKAVSDVSPRRVKLPTNSAVAQALVEFVYTMALVTPVQRDVRVLATLLTLPNAAIGEGAVPGLREAIIDALHQQLTNENAVEVWQAATLASAWGLQLRCMQVMLQPVGHAPSPAYTQRDLAPNALDLDIFAEPDPAPAAQACSKSPSAAGLSTVRTSHLATPTQRSFNAEDGAVTPRTLTSFPAPPNPAHPQASAESALTGRASANYSFPAPRMARRSSTMAVTMAQEAAAAHAAAEQQRQTHLHNRVQMEQREQASRLRADSSASLAAMSIASTGTTETVHSLSSSSGSQRNKPRSRGSILDGFRLPSGGMGRKGDLSGQTSLESLGGRGELPVGDELERRSTRSSTGRGRAALGKLGGILGLHGLPQPPTPEIASPPTPQVAISDAPPVLPALPRRTSSIPNLLNAYGGSPLSSPTSTIRHASLAPSISTPSCEGSEYGVMPVSPGAFDRPPPPPAPLHNSQNQSSIYSAARGGVGRRPSAVSVRAEKSQVTPWELVESVPLPVQRKGSYRGKWDEGEEADAEWVDRQTKSPRSPGESWKKLL